jgi:hypothetical protein
MGNNRNYGNNNNNRSNNNRNNGNNNNNNQDDSKRSWAKYGIIKSGDNQGLPYVYGYKLSKQGLIVAKVWPYKGGKETNVSQNGNVFLRMICTLTVGLGAPRLIPCLYNTSNKKVVLEDISMVISPVGSGKLKNGTSVSGYFGKNFQD